jgi:uncharacterized Zn-finger protein
VAKTDYRRNVSTCPWQHYPTHRRNRQIQVHGDVPLSYGHCAQELDCAHCAGTLYQPNIALEVGRPSVFVECPFCDPEGFRKRVVRLRDRLPVGSGPTDTPVTQREQKTMSGDAAAFEAAKPKPKRRPL